MNNSLPCPHIWIVKYTSVTQIGTQSTLFMLVHLIYPVNLIYLSTWCCYLFWTSPTHCIVWGLMVNTFGNYIFNDLDLETHRCKYRNVGLIKLVVIDRIFFLRDKKSHHLNIWSDITSNRVQVNMSNFIHALSF